MVDTGYRTRGSAADREVNCSGAIGHEGPEYDENSPEAQTGTRSHTALAMVVEGLPPDLERLAQGLPDPEAFRIAVHTGIKMWRELLPWMPGASSEVKLCGLTTKGTSDVVSVIEVDGVVQSLRLGDWKLGMSDDEHPNQLRAYALAAVDQFGAPRDGVVSVWEAWLMKGKYRVDHVSLDELERFRARLTRQHEQAGQQFAAGPWCGYCPIRVDCGMRDKYLRSAGNALSEIDPRAVSRETLGALFDRARMLRKALAEYDKALKLALADGPVAIGGGRQAHLETTETVTFPEPSKVFELLRGHVDADKLVAISKASLERAIKSKAAKGQGAKALRATMATLESEGLVDKKPRKTIKVVNS